VIALAVMTVDGPHVQKSFRGWEPEHVQARKFRGAAYTCTEAFHALINDFETMALWLLQHLYLQTTQ
jgi:hypothetical protein